MNEADTATGRHLILYDGVCGLCNKWVQQILVRDPEGTFHFAPLQSNLGRSLLLRYGKDPEGLDTIYVIADYKGTTPRILARSQALLFVIGRLQSAWRFLRVFDVLPEFLANAAYAMLARNRYRLFGKHDQCLMPTPEYAARFIDL